MFQKLPQDILHAILTSGTIRECLEILKNIRLTCVQMRKICCSCAEMLDTRVRDEVERIMKGFPRWFNQRGIRTITIEEWIHHGMNAFRRDWYQQIEMTQHLDRSNQIALKKKEEAILELLEVPDILHFTESHICYTLLSKVKDQSLCVEGDCIVHVNLDSIIKWFYQNGSWHLDKCSALLFSRTCAQRFDAGSSWMVLSEFTDFVIKCYRPLNEFKHYVTQKIRSSAENELTNEIKKRYTVQWTSEVYNNFYILHSQSVKMFSSKSNISSYERKFNMQSLSREALEFHTGLIAEITDNGAHPNTIQSVTRKLNACLPLSTLCRQTAML